MKKSLFVLGVAVAALASCTNEETVQVSQGLTIGFSGTGVDNVTKADITSADFHQFLVYGGYGAGAHPHKIQFQPVTDIRCSRGGRNDPRLFVHRRHLRLPT